MKKVLAKFFDERMNEKWTKNVSSIDSLNFRMESKNTIVYQTLVRIT